MRPHVHGLVRAAEHATIHRTESDGPFEGLNERQLGSVSAVQVVVVEQPLVRAIEVFLVHIHAVRKLLLLDLNHISRLVIAHPYSILFCDDDNDSWEKRPNSVIEETTRVRTDGVGGVYSQ